MTKDPEALALFECDFTELLWFKLLLCVIYLTVVCIAVLIIYFISDTLFISLDTELLYWAVGFMIYLAIYTTSCCLLEKYCGRGRGRTGSVSKPRPVVKLITWLWAMLFLAASVGSLPSIGYTNPLMWLSKLTIES